MTRFIARRLVGMVFVLIVTSMVTFAIFIEIPGGDPAVRLAGRTPTPQNIANIRTQFGFDQPVYVQYWRIMKSVGNGTLVSYIDGTNVRSEIETRFPTTLSIVLGSMVLVLFFGVGLGIASAVWAGSVVDRIIAILVLGGLSMPIFWAAIELRYVFADTHRVLPAGGYTSLTTDPLGWMTHALLPCTVFALTLIGVYARVLRTSMVDISREEYVRTAKVKGLGPRRIWTRHILRNALLPIVTLLGLDFAAALAGGTILIEQVFDIHGIGQYAANAVATLDLPPLLGVTLYGAAVVVILNAVADIAYVWVDPRVRAAR